MGLLSFLERKRDAGDTPSPQQQRVRARRRLIGAVVLVVAAIIGFPLLFETQPRPVDVDIPIEIPRPATAPPLALPAPPPATTASAPGEVPRGPLAAQDETPAEPAAPPEPHAASKSPAKAPVPAREPARAEAAAPAPRAAPVPPPPTVARAKESARVEALLEGKAPAKASPADRPRFVVQVGAFAEAAAARDVRARVEKLGFKTYTQNAQTSAGTRTRVRVGPFDSRDEADKAAGRIKAAGLPSVVLTL